MSTKADGPCGSALSEGLGPLLDDALGAYWDAAYAEGRGGRDHDTEDGAAQTALLQVRVAVAALVAAERERRVKVEKAQASVHVLVLTAVHHAVEACASATGQHRVIAHFVNKTHLANEVMEAVSSVAAEARA